MWQGREGEGKKWSPHFKVMGDFGMVQMRVLPERSVEPNLSLCEAFYQALVLDVLLVSFNLFSFFSRQEAKKTASFLMNLSPDRKVSFICCSVTVPYIFHFTFWGPAEQ